MQIIGQSKSSCDNTFMTYKYNSAILGGTFDHFHLGHEQFIVSAFTQVKHITIGLVHDLLGPAKSHLNSLEDYHTRLNKLETFLHKQNLAQREHIIPIFDIYGTTLTDHKIETIFVTPTTRPNALIINQERKSRGMSPLTIVTIKESVGDDGEIISSSRIRAGQIDRRGSSYLKFFLSQKQYHLPSHLRQALQHPLGSVISTVAELSQIIPPKCLIIAVGDIVAIDLKKNNVKVALNIVDYRTRRHATSQSEIAKYLLPIHYHLVNPPGNINKQFAPMLQEAISHSTPQIILVDGEEDLLALPTMLLAPLNTYVIYGQYNLGMVVVRITEEIKAEAKRLLAQF